MQTEFAMNSFFRLLCEYTIVHSKYLLCLNDIEKIGSSILGFIFITFLFSANEHEYIISIFNQSSFIFDNVNIDISIL